MSDFKNSNYIDVGFCWISIDLNKEFSMKKTAKKPATKKKPAKKAKKK
jgi:hypothetical protein